MLSVVLCAVLLVSCASAEGRLFSAVVDENEAVYDLFEIQRLVLDDSRRVTAVMGQYERVTLDENGFDVPAMAGQKAEHTYPLAENAVIRMGTDPFEDLVDVDDLYAWYVENYMNGEEPENGELTYSMDLPEGDFETQVDFWFLTVKISLNDQGEITYMQYQYTPWQ